MLTLIVLLWSVVSVTANAFMPTVGIMRKTAAAAEKSLNETELRFDEELAHSLKKAEEVIANIPGMANYFSGIIIADILFIVNKVDFYVVEPARKYGLNTTECDQLTVNIVQAANDVNAKQTFCVDKIVNRTGRYMKSIEKLAGHVHQNFTAWRTSIREVPSTAINSQFTMSAYTTLNSTVETAETQLQNYLHKLRQKIAEIEESGTVSASEDCMRATEEYSSYERKYSSYPVESKNCIKGLFQTVELYELYKTMYTVD